MEGAKKKRVLIVGAGAAGVAAAFSLSKCKDKFDVEVWEKGGVAGGVACSSDIEGGLYINDGVQGGCPSYRNTLSMMKEFGFKTKPVTMMISFGKGPTAWTNYSKTELTKKLKAEIAKFERVLKIINKFEAIFIFLPIAKVLRWFGFSEEFGNLMVFPLTALFFGTGNQTPYVSSAIMARVFLDDDLRLFEYDPELLLSGTPEMFAFPKLEEMYETVLRKTGVKFYPNRPVKRVARNSQIWVADHDEKVERFDEIIFACDAETALKVLDKPTFAEERALGNVQYYDDLIVTHEDQEYMERNYELNVDKDLYFIRTDPVDSRKIEMSFNLSNYQPQLEKTDRNIFQTIYLDKNLKDVWTVGELRKDKIRLERWWHQFAHTWTHFAFAVPFMRYIQGRQHSWYCGSYTLINTHEIAVISGLAAAHRLGAPYPFESDPLATKQFDQYLLMIHGQPRTKGVNKGTILSHIMAPFMALFAFLSFMFQLFSALFS